MNIITKLSYMKTMIQCGGIWFANGKFGITWRFVQGMIQPRISMSGRCHLSITSSESSTGSQKSIQNDHHDAVEDVAVRQPQPQFTTETVDSDDDVGEEEEEDDATPSRIFSVPVVAAAPTPVVEAPKKKIVKKVGGGGA